MKSICLMMNGAQPFWLKGVPGFLLCVILALPAGCSSHKQAHVTGVTPTRMKTLVACYGGYVSKHQGRMPPDEDAFKVFIRSDSKGILAKSGQSDVDSLFVSDRDGKPFIIPYAKSSPNREFGPEMIVALEAVGAEGKRLAAFPSGVVRELDPATLDAVSKASAK